MSEPSPGLPDRIRDILAAESKRRSGQSWPQLGPKLARAGFRLTQLTNGRGPELDRVRETRFGGVGCREYLPTSPRPGVIVFLHGGGFVLGDLDSHDATCRRIADQSGTRTIAVDYRLSPEHPYPAPLDDCEAATRAIVAALGVPFSQTVLMGDSAGGCLAVATAARLLATGVRLAGQCLLYPAFDSRCRTESYHEFASGYGLTAETMHWFWSQYLGPIDRDAAPPDASPFERESVAGLPPTYLLTCEYDVLRDEGEQFAARLRASHIPTRAVRWPRVIHGFIQLAGLLPAGLEATEEAADVAAAMIAGRFGELAESTA